MISFWSGFVSSIVLWAVFHYLTGWQYGPKTGAWWFMVIVFLFAILGGASLLK